MRVKICGITQPEQGTRIASMGATALGFICVDSSPRYVTPEQIRSITQHLPAVIDRVGVFANADLETIQNTVKVGKLNVVQLHGSETPEECQQVKSCLPDHEIIKALRIRNTRDLDTSAQYIDTVDALLLDAYHPTQLGGTGKTLDWQELRAFNPKIPWLLAGGLTPDTIVDALTQLKPDSIDLSSGVETSPGQKDLQKVEALFSQLASIQSIRAEGP